MLKTRTLTPEWVAARKARREVLRRRLFQRMLLWEYERWRATIRRHRPLSGLTRRTS